MTRFGLLAAALVLLVGITGCTGNNPQAGSADNIVDDRLAVVATISPITSLVESIGGDRIALTGIVPEGVNSHTYGPAPSVSTTIARADLIFANGLFLEEPTIRLAESTAPDHAVIVLLADEAVAQGDWIYDFAFPESRGRPNPHLWTAPHLAGRFAAIIHEHLVRLDPTNADYYDANLRELSARITDLDARILAAAETIPEGHRKLLTYHDSFPYFAERYGFEVIGAVQPADFSEPSAREVADFITLVRETGVPAVFGSEVFPSPVMEAIAEEGGAVFIDQLRDDDLPGAPGNPRHSYLGLMLTNMETMISALGGDTAPLDGFDPSQTYAGKQTAVYPQ